MKKILLLMICLSCKSVLAVPTATSYAVFGKSGIDLQSYSAVNGDIYSGGVTSLEFGYGIQVSNYNGNVQSQGNFALGSLSTLTGNVNSNGALNVEGSAQIHGNGVYGTTASVPTGGVTGSLIQQSATVPTISMLPASVFTPGTADVNTGNNLPLAPGSYGAVTETGLFKTVAFSSGVYNLKSLTLQGNSGISLNIINNQPITICCQGDISLSSGLSITVNGIPFTSPSSGIDNSLAKLVTFETDGNFNNPAGFLNYFFGTIFAPNGNINMQFNNMEGALLAGGTITGTGYVDYQPSVTLQAVPEPGTAALMMTGLILAAVSMFAQRRTS